MTNPREAAGKSQAFEELRQRYESLRDKKISAETQLKDSEERLDKLKKQARETYGTDDLDALQKKLETMKEENERLRADYQNHLDEVEGRLKTVEQQHQKENA